MNFIDKLIVLIGDDGKSTAAHSRCWPGDYSQGLPPFPGTLISSGTTTSAVYTFPRNDPCINEIIKRVSNRPCSSGAPMPCCARRSSNGKCVEINSLFVVPFGGSGTAPSGEVTFEQQVPAGTPLLARTIIEIQDKGLFKLTVQNQKPHLGIYDLMPPAMQEVYNTGIR